MTEERASNSVFTVPQPPGVDPRIPMTTAASQVKADFGLEIPVEIAPLPSAGRIYPVGSALYGRETLEIRAGTAREEDILTSQALMKKGTVINELIRSCLVDKTINPTDLVSGDRNALMVAIRITMYGQDYDAEVTCQECEVKTPQTFDLANLPIRKLSIDPVQEGTNLFEFLLPYSKKLVKFRFLTGRDEEEISTTAAKQKKLQMVTDASVTTQLQYSIVSVDAIEDRAKIAAFVRMMPARDSLALRNYIKENDPGLVMRQEVTCPSCNHSEEVMMPIGINFLWPGAGR